MSAISSCLGTAEVPSSDPTCNRILFSLSCLSQLMEKQNFHLIILELEMQHCSSAFWRFFLQISSNSVSSGQQSVLLTRSSILNSCCLLSCNILKTESYLFLYLPDLVKIAWEKEKKIKLPIIAMIKAPRCSTDFFGHLFSQSYLLILFKETK